ncbi:MAG: histidine phosphatase family protein [Acidimicrobiales bacterium]|nr:histidine phosphatase family protein [Acidimicrobiales bacterium]
MPLLFVRHGHAGRRSAYKGDDRTRPLSKRGRAQGKELVGLLGEYRPQRILSSPYVRCCETVQPTAVALGLPVESIEELAEGHGPDTVRLMRRMAGEAAVLCSHGDVALSVLEAFGGPEEDGPARLQKGEVWVVQSKGSKLVIVDRLRPGTPTGPKA